MEFITSNLYNTTTSIAVGSGTLSVSNMLTRDKTSQYVSSGFNDDLTTTSITISFAATTSVSRLVLLGMNWKDFTIFNNGSTASVFSLTSTGATTSSDFSTNSESSMYMFATTAACTSVTFDILATQSANAEKAVGHIYLGDSKLDFERIPSAKNYKPIIKPKEIVHTLSDGAQRLNRLSDNFAAKIKYKNISTTFRNNLRTIYDTRASFGFAAFPTMTGWDEFFFNAIWTGPFMGYEFSDDAAAAGHTIEISLKEAE